MGDVVMTVPIIRCLEKKYPDLKSPSSPTLRVGSNILDKFESFKHKAPMLSLANAFNPCVISDIS